jgi:hypothetical protein
VRNSALQRSYDHIMAQRTAQGPTNYQPRKQIDDLCQIQPTCSGCQIGDIRYPHLIRRLDGKVSFHEVRCYRKAMFTVGGFLVSTSDLRTKSRLHAFASPHDFCSPCDLELEALGDLWSSITPFASGINLTDLLVQSLILDLPLARFPLQPSIIPTFILA